jgi:hypothetical protein
MMPVAFERTAVNTFSTITPDSPPLPRLRSAPRRRSLICCTICAPKPASIGCWGSSGRPVGRRRCIFFWLGKLYVDQVADYFEGDQPYGRAGDFIEDLLFTPPICHSQGEWQGRVGRSFGVAGQIIKMRNDIIAEWKEAMRNIPVNYQGGMRRLLLKKQMATWGSESSPLGGGSVGSDGSSSFQ